MSTNILRHKSWHTGRKENVERGLRDEEEHEENERVTDAHRLYLLTRDMTALSAVFLIAFGLAAAIWGCPAKVTWMYLTFLAFQYVTVSTAARNYGNRFATTVLAEVTAKLAGKQTQHAGSRGTKDKCSPPRKGGDR